MRQSCPWRRALGLRQAAGYVVGRPGRSLASLVVRSPRLPFGPQPKRDAYACVPPLALACELAFWEPCGRLGTGPGVRRTTGPDSRPGGASGVQVVRHPAGCLRAGSFAAGDSRARSAHPVARTVEIRPDLTLEKIKKLRASSLR
jgi:hypothetical protein